VSKYSVVLTETVSYTVEVEAEDAEQAAAVAEDAWAQSEDPYDDFLGSVENVSIVTLLQK
jgi:hypothetical protein